jgi:hypothetical protein
MSRPAAKCGEIATALAIPADQVPAKLAELHQAVRSIRLLADYLTAKGVPTSKSWVHEALVAGAHERGANGDQPG